MSRRVSLITLGVRDKARARAFYEALGWHGVDETEDDPVFFQAGQTALAPTFHDVDRVTQIAQRAGARLGRQPAPTFWGGYSSIVIDPDGHPWEIAYNPAWQVTTDGAVRLAAPPPAQPTEGAARGQPPGR